MYSNTESFNGIISGVNLLALRQNRTNFNVSQQLFVKNSF